MNIVSIRGAITIDNNEEKNILDNTAKLIKTIEKANNLEKKM